MGVGFNSFLPTFLACAKSIGTAITLAGGGAYLHRRGFLTADGKRLLALVSQQLTYPLFLFTKILYCDQNGSDEPCTDVKDSIQDVWILLVWPLFMMSSGIIVGNIMVRLTNTHRYQYSPVIAAVTFANNSGLPITLLAVVHNNYDDSTVLGSVDPTIFLSVYLIVYSVLQWGVGGWMLAPAKPSDEDEHAFVEEMDGTNQTYKTALTLRRISRSLSRNVLNNASCRTFDRVLLDADDGLFMDAKPNICSICHRKTTEQDCQLHLPLLGQDSQRSQRPVSLIVGMEERIRCEARNNVMPEDDIIDPRRLNSQQEGEGSLLESIQQALGYGLRNLVISTPLSKVIHFDKDVDPTALHWIYEGLEAEIHNKNDWHHKRVTIHTELNQSTSEGETVPTDASVTISELGMDMSGATAHHDNSCHNSLFTIDHQRRGNPNAHHYATSSSRHRKEEGTKGILPRLADFRRPSTAHPCLTPAQAVVRQPAQTSKRCETFRNVMAQVFQPPVIGALLGIFLALTPIRGILVDLETRSSRAPLQWFFDGLYSIGSMAVPVNMLVLGCNVAKSLESKDDVDSEEHGFKKTTQFGIVAAKLVVLPIVGITTCAFMKRLIDIPEEIAASLYLVLMVVFLTPTANNVMVMVELSGSNSKEAIAKAIALQYAFVPFLLTITLTLAVGVATDWE